MSSSAATVQYGNSTTATVTYDGDGTLSASVPSADSSYVTASISGGTLTINVIAYKSGTVEVTVSATAGSNYSAPDSKKFTVTLNKRTGVVITAKNQAVTYGTAITTGTGQVTVSGLASGDNLDSITLTPSTSNVTTTGTITPSGATIKKGTTNVTSYYDLTAASVYVAGNLTISQKKATITLSSTSGTIKYGSNVQITVTYDGDGTLSASVPSADSSYVGTSFNNPKTQLTISVTAYKSGTVVVTVSATAGSNYSAPDSKTYTVTLAKREITITANAQTVTYGTAISKTTSDVTISGDGLASGDSLTAITLVQSDTNVATANKKITPSAATITNATKTGYYTISYAQGNLTINQKKATIKLNNGTSNLSGSIMYGGSENVTVSYDGDGTLSASSANTEYVTTNLASGTLTISAIKYNTASPTTTYVVTVSATAGSNYSAPDSRTYTVTVAKRTITITATAQTITYGTSIATGTSKVGISGSGLASGDTLDSITLTPSTSSVTTTGTITPSDATIKKSTTNVTAYYNITYTAGNLTISKATFGQPSTVSWSTTNLGTATWSSVASIGSTTVKHYSVQLKSGSSNVGNAQTTSSTSYDFASAIRANGAGSYTFTVTVVSNDTTQVSSSSAKTSTTTLYATSVTVGTSAIAGISSRYINASGTSSYVMFNGQTVNISASMSNGYAFGSWQKTGNVGSFGSASTASTTFTIPANNTSTTAITLTPSASAITYNIKLNPNGGTLSTTTGWTAGTGADAGTYSSTYKVDGSGTVTTIPSASKTGWTFTGWTASAAVGNWTTTDTYSGGASLTGKYGDNVVLTAQYEIHTYTINVAINKTGGVNGNTNAPGTATIKVGAGDAATSLSNVVYGASVTLAASANTGYTFVNWTYGGNAITSPWTVAAQSATNATITLTANFSVNTFTIKYNPGTGATGTAYTVPTTYNYESTGITILNNTNANLGFAKTGHTFVGWTNADGSSTIKFSNYTTSLSMATILTTAGASTTSGTTVNLYPVWKANYYAITLTKNDGTFTIGYNSTTSTSITTLYAKYGVSTLYVATSGTPTYEGASGATLYAVTSIAASRTGYTLTAFSGTNATVAVTVAKSASTLAAGLNANYSTAAVGTLVATWKANYYALAITLNGGSLTFNNSSSNYTVSSDTTAANSKLYAKYGSSRLFYSASDPVYDGKTSTVYQITSISTSKTGYAISTIKVGTVSVTTSSTDMASAYATEGTGTLTANWTINTYTLTINYYYLAASHDTTLAITQADSTVAGSPIAKPTTNGTTYTSATVSHTYSTTALTVTIARSNTSYTYYMNVGSAPTTSSSTNSITYSWTPDENGTKAINVYVYERYTVEFNGNNKTGGTVPSTTYKIHGTNLTIAENNLTRTGYTANGWNTSSTLTTTPAYTASYTANASTTLYANWTLDTYTISYVLNGGSVSPSDANPTTYTYETTTFTLVNPTKIGHTFSGWTGSNGDSPSTSVSIANHSTGNKTFTANWTANTYSVTFAANSGTLTMAGGKTNPFTATYDTVYHISDYVSSITRTGYTFNGWRVTAGLNTSTGKYGTTNNPSTALTSSTNMENANYCKNLNPTASAAVTLTAQWTANTYTVIFAANSGTLTAVGGQLDANNKFTATYDTVYHISDYVSSITRTGYTFNGWRVTANLNTSTGKYGTTNNPSTALTSSTNMASTNYFKNLNPTNNAAVTLTEQWTAKTFTVAYDSNKPSGASASVGGTAVTSSTATYDSAYTAKANTWTITGWSFTGWNTATTGTGTSVSVGSVSASTVNTWFGNVGEGGTKTLYAQWKADRYAITLNPNGGSIAITYSDSTSVAATTSNQTVYAQYDSTTLYKASTGTVTVSTITTTKTGYTHNGYYVSETKKINASTAASLTAAYTSTSGATFTASWTAKQIRYQVQYYWQDLASGYTTVTKDFAHSSETFTTLTFNYKAAVSTYTLHETVGATNNDKLTGAVGSTVDAEIKTYTGFTHITTHADTLESQLIEATDRTDIVHTLKVYYNRTNYTMTLGAKVSKYNVTGQSGYNGTPTVDVPYNSAYTISGAAKTGYTFNGWYPEGASTGSLTNSDRNGTMTANTSYTAQLTAANYTVWFYRYVRYGSGTASAPNTTNLHLDSNTNGSTAIFGSLYNMSAGGTIAFTSSTYAPSSLTASGDNYTISVARTGSVTVTATAATGYTFVGWWTSSAFSGNATSTNASITVSNVQSAVNRYALFTANTYNLTINYNGGYVYGSSSTTSATVTGLIYGVHYSDPSVFWGEPYKERKKPNGLSYSGNGAVIACTVVTYSAAHPNGTWDLNNLTTTNGATVTTYINWTDPVVWAGVKNGNSAVSNSNVRRYYDTLDEAIGSMVSHANQSHLTESTLYISDSASGNDICITNSHTIPASLLLVINGRTANNSITDITRSGGGVKFTVQGTLRFINADIQISHAGTFVYVDNGGVFDFLDSDYSSASITGYNLPDPLNPPYPDPVQEYYIEGASGSTIQISGRFDYEITIENLTGCLGVIKALGNIQIGWTRFINNGGDDINIGDPAPSSFAASNLDLDYVVINEEDVIIDNKYGYYDDKQLEIKIG